MENTQSVQQQVSQAEAPIPILKKKKSKPVTGKNFLINVLAKYPLFLPIGLSGVFLASGTLALYTLGSVGSVKEEEPEILEAEVVQPISSNPTEAENPMPLWMILAIALSCGSGSLVLFLLLNLSGKRQMVKNHFNRYQARLTQRHQRMAPRPPRNKPVLVPAKMAPVAVPAGRAQPVVTVMPEQSMSRNSSQDALASVFDIRKHTPLSTILRKD
ncbi:hypothetical protein WA1_27905 [Scytonema hofmannii PCC 7110]|jgi:hypothetical protein|uniref:Uncharacterized protein n=1 Tax=Scytonema hofmannii PCC 7110 TaxID=128403 RepID=A0A139X6P1_9CYAN|nr:hypothetical protein [Scytonema hofmannii]KYC40354.1 hypothetical protein WA1_27905 [Scytonema hofmannii PCC 7110]